MARLKAKCISNMPYLKEGVDGRMIEGRYEGELVSLTVGNIYEVLEIEGGYYRVVDNSDEDYLYPKSMFELVK